MVTTTKQISKEAYQDKELQELLCRAIELFCKRHGISLDEAELIIPKNYILDTTYICMWGVRDFENIVSKLIRKTNTGQLQHDEFFRYLQRIYEDQTVTLDKNTTLEPIEIGRKKDRVTFEAVRDIWLNMIGIYQPPISHAMIGDGIGIPSYGQQSLFNEINRVPIKEQNDGSLGIRGETLFVNASFPSSLNGFTTREVGTANDSDPNDDRMQLYVQIDTPDQKAHVLGNDTPQFSTSASICTL